MEKNNRAYLENCTRMSNFVEQMAKRINANTLTTYHTFIAQG